jgi:hypothetical protein
MLFASRILAILAALLYWGLGVAGILTLLPWAMLPTAPFPTEGQTVLARASGLIYGEERIGQVVAVPRDGLVAIQFWLLAHRRDSSNLVILRVANPAAPEQPLARIGIPLRDLPANGPTTFPLPSFDQARTPILILILEAPDLDRDHAPAVLGADNLYGGGMLLANGAPRNGQDLAFQLFARKLQGDQLVPLSHLSSGRPTPFDQPELYLVGLWATAWVGVWALGQVLYAVVQHRPVR